MKNEKRLDEKMHTAPCIRCAKEKVDCVKCKAEQIDARVKEKPNKNAKEKVDSDRAKFLFNLVCFNFVFVFVCAFFFLHFGYE